MLDTTDLDTHHPGYLDAVRAFAASLGLEAQLQKQLDFLADYGNSGLDPDDPSRRPTRCVLGWDFAPHSFSFAIFGPDGHGGEKYWFNGGLLYQGPSQPADGSGPLYSVSLFADQGWFIHT